MKNLGEYYDNAIKKFGNNKFIEFYGESITFNEFGNRVNRLANGLLKLGFKKGDFIHVFVQNNPEVLISYCAIHKIGAVAGPINGWWKSEEVEYLLNDSKGRGLIIEDQYRNVFDPIKDKCKDLEIIIEYGDNPDPNHVDFKKLISDSPDDHVHCESELDDTCYIFYTSGTTGKPKGVLLSHKNILADVNGISDHLALRESMVILLFLPLFHVNAMITFSFSFGMGFLMVIRRQFSASEFWEVVSEHKVNFWSGVPAVYQILLTDPGRQKYDLSSLEFGICGAAPLSKETMDNFEKTFNIPIYEGYGLTEATCVSTLNPIKGTRKPGSIGKALPGQIVKIVNEDGHECKDNEPGEILIGGDVVMKEYYNKPEDTAEAIEDGFLHTGDVGYRDEDGYIFIVDRIKDMVIRGGENIYPKEIDNVIMSNPKVADAASIGVPDEFMGEEVKAFVIAADDTLTEEEVIEYCKKNLANFKVPKYVEILEDDFPRNPMGKVLKKELKKWGLTPRPKKSKAQITCGDIIGSMPDRVRPEAVEGINAKLGYDISGTGGGQWTIYVKDGKVTTKEGLDSPDVLSKVSAKDFIDITLGKLDGMTAFTSGRLKVEGDMSLLTKSTKFFKKFTPPKPEPVVTPADIINSMPDRAKPDVIKDVKSRIAYDLAGTNGGQWTIIVDNGKVEIKEGIHEPDVLSKLSAKDFVDITLGKLDGMTAFSSGRLSVEGDLSLVQKSIGYWNKFVPPKAEIEVTPADIINSMPERARPEAIEKEKARVSYDLAGTNGGQWTIIVDNGKIEIKEGIHDPDVLSKMSAKDFVDITLGKLDGMTAFTSGRLKVEGDLSLVQKSTKFFKKFTPASGEEEEKKGEELIMLKQTLSINNDFSTGPLMGKFLKELRDNKRILGNKCPVCGRMQIPPREVCAECRVRVNDLIEVGPEGEVVIYDVAYYASPDPLTGESRETPYCSLFVILDGCAGNDLFWHELKPEDIDRVKKGMRVRPVWNENRTGTITDIKYFEIID